MESPGLSGLFQSFSVGLPLLCSKEEHVGCTMMAVESNAITSRAQLFGRNKFAVYLECQDGPTGGRDGVQPQMLSLKQPSGRPLHHSQKGAEMGP